ncbi:polyprenyl synthetase family protein [Pediococcus pentosaceus]|jgi:geranylgeranyl diphosphate synthase type II|uniref:Farnesyl diphosphate synthase n=1 Tax=Pediococcus pentosaceus TaxID=1255 RepID=A0AA40X8C7_PEDPE|nr:farnesyl diphosphate synthase [Pediococcus pentosaceus]AHA04947.1 farnesyl-diphosphate synthase [Pediococcus pentosaceus SL4]KAF0349692.1 polyprenyl synthetase family protein [Pediococcus pentosaceus]KAF0422186.1 polyprenyl synthetase family protein [Pediococcus pentosaceus]KAF0524106.1 polyprenyl synthetase family protein [Pediococcus pentosaceus]MBF7105757.1 polyprenyl synthetase family protein [Pediococcus pentosaceus]
MNSNFDDFVKQNVELLDQHIDELFDSDSTLNTDLKMMMKYSIDAGGKRVRPLVLLAILKAFRKTPNYDILTVAAALEAVHTYSLIHDDLPAMDNDDLRRGRPTSHKKFGEAEAILAGDALLTVAFQWISSTNLKDRIKSELVLALASDAGASGMIAGQLLDIQGNQRHYSLAELKHLHHLKTGKMLLFPAEAALIMKPSKLQVAELVKDFMANFGLAFQIHDDIIDVTESTAILGKTAGKDVDLNKNTYVNLLGLSGAKEELNQVLQKCEQDLTSLGELQPEMDLMILEGFLTYLK